MSLMTSILQNTTAPVRLLTGQDVAQLDHALLDTFCFYIRVSKESLLVPFSLTLRDYF